MTQELEKMSSSPCANTRNDASIPGDTSSKGILVPLKTTMETRARESLISVYVTRVPVKQASRTLELIRRLLPGDGGVDLQHLRRFAKISDVPRGVTEVFEAARVNSLIVKGVGDLEILNSAVVSQVPISKDLRKFPESRDMPRQTLDTLGDSRAEMVIDIGDDVSGNPNEARGSLVDSGGLSPSSQISRSTVLKNGHASASTLPNSRVKSEDVTPKDLFLIVGSTNAITHAVAAKGLSSVVNDAIIFSIEVPRLAPTSQEQALLWSSNYWPTVYKKSNPFGPHPSIVSRTELEVREDTEKWMNLASEVAQQADLTGYGERVGVVIVERRNGVGSSIAVAGDARWENWPRNGPGNATGHAVLRAIAMVAARVKIMNEIGTVSFSTTHPEVEITPADHMITDGFAPWDKKSGIHSAFIHGGNGKQAHSHSAVVSSDAGNIFHDKPFLAAEKEHYDESGTDTGYLCHELEIYCTHEPCVMCSMAIVHSRFGKVIFRHRMPSTGAMCAEGDLGHGLFWRKELNWTLLAWQWFLSKDDHQVELADFHA